MIHQNDNFLFLKILLKNYMLCMKVFQSFLQNISVNKSTIYLTAWVCQYLRWNGCHLGHRGGPWWEHCGSPSLGFRSKQDLVSTNFVIFHLCLNIANANSRCQTCPCHAHNNWFCRPSGRTLSLPHKAPTTSVTVLLSTTMMSPWIPSQAALLLSLPRRILCTRGRKTTGDSLPSAGQT